MSTARYRGARFNPPARFPASRTRREARPKGATHRQQVPRNCIALVLLAGCLASLGRTRAATFQVGPTRASHTVASLPALNPGDVVEIDPATYNEVKRWTRSGTAVSNIIVRGVGASRPVFDAAGLGVSGALPNPRAVFQIEANYITVENIEFKNARNGDNGAGIRVTAGDNVAIRNCKITACDMGIMCDNNSNLLIEASEIAFNGTPLYDGYSHNLYLGGNNSTLRFCYIHDSQNGQNFKSRAHYTELLYNYIADSQDGEIGLVDASETTAVNSHAVMIGNIVISKPRLSGYNSGRFIQFGQDSGLQHRGTLFAFNNTFIAGDGRVQFLSANSTGSTVVAVNNIFYGSGNIVGTLGGGISGSNNWAQATANVPATFSGTVRGSDPGFINRAGLNLHLTAASACRNQGSSVLSYLDGTGLPHSGIPAFEYVNHLQNRARRADGQLDLGAYEYRVPELTSLRLIGNDCFLDFSAVAGNQYELHRANDLAAGNWVSAITNIPGIDGVIEIIDMNGAGQPRRFYRMKASL